MSSAEEDWCSKPTKEEVFRDFFIFWFNHREHEKLFRHDFFMNILSKIYGIPHDVTDMKHVERVVLSHPLTLFLDTLRECFVLLHSKTAKSDMCDLISYAKEAL